MECWKIFIKRIGNSKSIFWLLTLEFVVVLTLMCCTYHRVSRSANRNMEKITLLKDSTTTRSARLAGKIRELTINNVNIDLSMPQINMKNVNKPASGDGGESTPPAPGGNVCRCDSLIGQILVEVNADFNHRLDNILADLRQESNNQINWLNVWITVWLSSLSIVGVVLPVVISYAINSKARNEIGETVKQMECRMDKWNAISQITTVINCARTLKELGRQHFTPEQKRYWLELLPLLIDKNEIYIGTFEENNKICTEKEIMVYFLQIQVLMKALEPYYIFPRSHMIFSKIKADLKKCLKKYASSTNSEIISWLKQLQSSLKELSDATEEEVRSM